MAKNTPSFQFYPSDFLGGVSLLTEEETGVYWKLCCGLWIQGNLLSFCFSKMARAANVPVEVLEKVWPAISDKFDIQDGMVQHPRFAKMMELAAIRSNSGKKGGRPEKQNESKTQSKTQSKSEANSSKSEERRMKDKIEEGVQGEDWVFPAGWDRPDVREALDGWAAMRARIRKPVRSKLSASKIFKRFDSANHLAEVAEICEANEWQGLKPDMVRQNHPQQPLKTFAQQKLENTKRAMEEFVNGQRSKVL